MLCVCFTSVVCILSFPSVLKDPINRKKIYNAPCKLLACQQLLYDPTGCTYLNVQRNQPTVVFTAHHVNEKLKEK